MSWDVTFEREDQGTYLSFTLKPGGAWVTMIGQEDEEGEAPMIEYCLDLSKVGVLVSQLNRWLRFNHQGTWPPSQTPRARWSDGDQI